MRPAHLLFLLLTLSTAGAQPLITEFVAVNSSSLTDGDGNTPDWIELHNPDPTPFDISGYHLTDDVETPQKYTFPADTNIPAGGYLVVFASAQETSDYRDAEGNFHTNFSLSSNGEYLALNAPGGAVLQAFSPAFPSQREDISYGISNTAITSTIIDQGATSKWLVPTSDIGDSWQLSTFDDASWASADTGIGYGYDNTLVSPEGDARNQMFFGNPSAYLRIPFDIPDPGFIDTLTLGMRFDDGFIAYLNGTRIAAANAPGEDSIAFNSTATAQQDEDLAIVNQDFIVPPTALVAGTNTLAIHGLNFSSAAANSNDFLILPELSATTSNESGTLGYFANPTPGEVNDPTQIVGFVSDTKFSHDRGYYTDSFDLIITSQTPDSSIFYTTDGTPPSLENGTLYTSPITINSTTTIRAIATRENFQPTNIDTQTYLFVDDILRQTRPSGYPATWAGAAADYAMDPDIVDDPDYADQFDEAFAALPTLSLVFDPDALFHPSTGIYQRPQSQGSSWERPLSAEFMVSDDSEPGFQINAGIRVQGGSSRNPDTPKHSLSLRFRAEYGDSKLDYPLYENSPVGETAVEEFDLLQLRPEYNYGWMHRHWYQADNALYGRDQWVSDIFNSMGRTGSHGRWVHLFLNGIYWGLYDLHERPDADHMANYLGGDQSDYDTVNSSVATNGDLVAYNQMMNLAYGSIQTQNTFEAIQEYLDVDAFADYMILNAYIGNRDWDGHNWRAGRKREAGAPYLFFPWDSEFAVSHVSGGVFNSPPNFFTTALTTNVTGNNGNRRPTGLQTRLQLNLEYRLRYADRVRAHFFNGGPLSPAVTSDLWTTRSTPMTTAIIAESARWGDFRRDVSSGRWSPANFDLYTRDDHYLPTHDWLVDTYIPQRANIVLSQFRARGLYPSTDAPDFSTHGGTIPRGLEITISAPANVHYTTDGSDPRLTGGDINPDSITIAPGDEITLNQSTLLKARTRASNGTWSALTEATFTVDATELQITEIMYHPIGNPLAEFLELTNTGDFEISLTGLQFTQGITFDFNLHAIISTLAPGAQLLIVRDRDAFEATYGNAFDSIIAGSFQEGTALSNGGENLTISDADGNTVFRVRYRDDAPWPTEADTLDHSLVFTGGDPALAQNWRASTTPGGNPGSTDSLPFTGGSLLDYALVSTTISDDHTQLIWTSQLAADDVIFLPQHSSNLEDWTDLTTPIVSQTIDVSEGTRTFVIDLPSGTTGFGRVRVLQR